MKKRLMMALAAGALVAAMVPGVAAAGADPQADFVPIVVPSNGQTPNAQTVWVPEVAASPARPPAKVWFP